MTFKSLGLSEAVLKAVTKKGYNTPSPIQEKAIPHILNKSDVLASAQTGTGKTAGFTLPMVHLLSQEAKHSSVRALILTPTRELAAQVYDNARAYAEYTNLKTAVIFGGVNAKPQITTLKRGVDVLVATPGRLIDLIEQKALTLKHVEFFVLDEADRMLDMGFQRDINKVIGLLPKKRQNLLFSATFSKEIKALATNILHKPVSVETAPNNTAAETVKQKVYNVNKSQKAALLIKLVKDGHWRQVLVFTRTKHGANKLSEKLAKAGITSAAIHGNKSQGARTKALQGFKENKIRVLVATDIAARGLDIPLLPHVVNYELPNVPEDYVHRIGRTGRAGANGEAISLVASEELAYVKSIEKLLKKKFEATTVEGFDYVISSQVETEQKKPSKQKRNKRSSRNNKSDKKQDSTSKKGNHRGSNSNFSKRKKEKKQEEESTKKQTNFQYPTKRTRRR